MHVGVWLERDLNLPAASRRLQEAPARAYLAAFARDAAVVVARGFVAAHDAELVLV